MNGYRKMISEKIPQSWDIPLRICKCRTRWIEYVYSTIISKYSSKKLKSKTVKEILGLSKTSNGVTLHFDDSIDWSTLRLTDLDEYKYWYRVSMWIKWYSTISVALEEYIKHCYFKQYNLTVAAEEINKVFHINNIKTTLFILNQLKYGQ